MKKINALRNILLVGYVFLVSVSTCFQSVSGTQVIGENAVKDEDASKSDSADKTQMQDKHVEIEKKFVIDYDKIPQDLLNKVEKKEIIQYYIKFDPETRVRSVNNKKFFRTEKREISGSNLSRVEIEEEISKAQYNDILNSSSSDFYIKKCRYNISLSNDTIELDIYSDELKGLVTAEIEFDSEESANQFVPPNWFGEEVTSNKEFKNAGLAKKSAKIRSLGIV